MRSTLLLLLIAFYCSAQDKLHKVTPSQSEQYCVYVGKHDAANRKSFYPFNKSVKIELIGFLDEVQWTNLIKTADSARNLKKEMYIKLDDKSYRLNKGRLMATTVLSHHKIDELTDILYNYKYPPMQSSKGSILIDEPVGCYNPRNAIVFKDLNNKIIEYIEICFECSKSKFSSAEIRTPNYCGRTYRMLKDFFVDNGIAYGTTYLK
ncbi:hypothetical protein LT679_09780 [Mucilaginibacter roseus]|uniref:Uncharacterized protein n=1 Tax=Mucilaginibacter roseus TaxID=1528868 RepID=A0ABS8U4Y9_9SPHI|nr:hypothetical protein [Mucilaginibacter roseus]MCD8740889.1 hypothetical protein [Mucilaginibacter roseus]